MMESSDDLMVAQTTNASNANVSQINGIIDGAIPEDMAPEPTTALAGSSSIAPVFDFNISYKLPAVEIPSVPNTVRDEIEENYRCPVSQDLWFDPVQTPNGKVYEREQILRYLIRPTQASSEGSAPLSKNCPLDGTPLEATDLVNIAQQLLNIYRNYLKNHPQLWHEVYIPTSYQQALQDACFAQGTVSLEIQVRRHALALTHVMLPTGYLLVEALCEPHVNTRELLPWVTAQLKTEQWQDLVRQRSVQQWLQRAANAVFHAEAAAVGFVKALEQHLNLSFEPQTFLRYALSLESPALVHLVLACHPEFVTTVDVDGNTLLHQAVNTGDVLLADILLKRGYDAHVKNHAGQKPAHLIHQSPALADLFTRHQFTQSFNRLRPKQQANMRHQFIATEITAHHPVTTPMASSSTSSVSPHVEGDLPWFEAFNEPYYLPKWQTPDIATIPQWLIAKDTNRIAYDPCIAIPLGKIDNRPGKKSDVLETYEGEEVSAYVHLFSNLPLKQAIEDYLMAHPEVNALQYVSPQLIKLFISSAKTLDKSIKDFREGPSPTAQYRITKAALGEAVRINTLTIQNRLEQLHEQDRRFLATLVMELEPNKPQTLPELILQNPDLTKALLSTWLGLVTANDWQEMLRNQPLQYWLELFARVTDHDANLAIQAIRQMQQGLGLKFNPLAFVQYAVGHEDVHLLKLAVTCYPEVINTPMAQNGNTLLHIAVQLNALDKVKFLVEAGASINIRNQNREKPSDLAQHLTTSTYNYLNRCKTMQRYERLSPEMQAQIRQWLENPTQQSSTMSIPSSSSSSSIGNPSGLSSSNDPAPGSASVVISGNSPGLWSDSATLANRTASQSLYDPKKPTSSSRG